jgi:serralysin
MFTEWIQRPSAIPAEPGRKMRGRLTGAAAVLLCSLVPIGCGDEVVTVEGETRLTVKNAPTWEEFRDAARYNDPASDVQVYVVEGDIALNEDGLRRYYERHYLDQAEKSSVLTSGGSDVVFNSTDKLNITYCISNAWGNQKAMALADMREATAQWMSAANVVFTYVPGQDAACAEANTGVRLNVLPHSGGGLGCAPYQCRYIKMNYAANFDLYSWLGAWTHEVGHTLGLWHEHIRAECGINEGVTIRAVTGYDNSSSLHYSNVCGSKSTGQMTPLDKTGAASLYGASPSPSVKVLPAFWIGSSTPAALD